MADSIPRNLTRPVHVGNVTIGGGAPVVVQSMTCTPTVDLDATLKQVTQLAEAGCDVVRVSVPTKEALGSFRDICRESPVPIVADIHFDYRLALAALDAGAAKLRINPGNIGSWEKVDAIIAWSAPTLHKAKNWSPQRCDSSSISNRVDSKTSFSLLRPTA